MALAAVVIWVQVCLNCESDILRFMSANAGNADVLSVILRRGYEHKRVMLSRDSRPVTLVSVTSLL